MSADSGRELPNRMIRESALTSTTLYRLSDGAERLFWRMTLIADDYGRFESDPQVLKAKCFPLWPDARLKAAKVSAYYAEMEACELIQSYYVGGKHYGHFPTWENHQRVRAKASKHPAPSDDNIRGHMLTNVAVVESRESRVEKEEEESISRSTPGVDPVVPKRAERHEQSKEVLAFLNSRRAELGLGQFRPVETHLRLIAARLADGASVQDCKSIVARKVREWKDEPKTVKWMRPMTIFRASNFENYIGELAP